ncbi:MAG: hypothetical protein K2X11_03735 [Acetobacteraceae bacterium]|nr:hypothetical protein [Acetobacteraceae bacterium]
MSGSTTRPDDKDSSPGDASRDHDLVPPLPEDVPGSDLAEQDGTSEPDGLPEGEA